ncbi:Uncharacterised protein [Mycobacteroides abscessus subsp. massiliense]|uniref:hypothetical protein n=1 Tax=Mycobacteroides abscessus TaxID=36809 RepID=UPI0009A8E341|nr:hypothetical protein [Mycobacteroides abscessus]SLE83537.1 Uncharacterised protein [Mycobacteroides abscessus subsp. massiliense]
MTAAQTVIAVATLIVSVITALMVYSSNSGATAQREQQARREQWWSRFEFSMNLALDLDNPAKRRIGVRVIEGLSRSPLAGNDELAVLASVVDMLVFEQDNGVQREAGR